VSSDGANCGTDGWQQGWIVLSGTTVIYSRPQAPRGFVITASSGATSLSFQPTGVGATAAIFTICRATPSAGSQERVVTIDASGRASVKRTTTGTCA